MTEREKMLAGELYDCSDPGAGTVAQSQDLVQAYNQTASEALEEKDQILTALLGKRGANLWITPPFLWITALTSFWRQL